MQSLVLLALYKSMASLHVKLTYVCMILYDMIWIYYFIVESVFLHLFQKLEAWLRRRKSYCARRRWLSLGRSWCRTVLRRPRRGQGLRTPQDARGTSFWAFWRLQFLFIATFKIWSWSRGVAQGEGLEGDPATDGERWEESEGPSPKSDKRFMKTVTCSVSFHFEQTKRIKQTILLLCFTSFTLLSLCFVHLCSLFWKALVCESQRRIVSACWRARPPMRKSCRPYLNTRSDNWRRLRNSSFKFIRQVYHGLPVWMGSLLLWNMTWMHDVTCVSRVVLFDGHLGTSPSSRQCHGGSRWYKLFPRSSISSIVLRFMAATGFGWLRHAMATWIFPGTLCLPLLSVGICVASFSPCLQLASLLVSHSVSAVGTLQLTGAWSFLCHHQVWILVLQDWIIFW